MAQTISDIIRKKVAQRANFRCEYCLIPERFLATVFHIDHIRSIKHNGKTQLSNLAFACPHCNQFKGSDIATFINEEDESITRLFNPRKDIWQEHFEIYQGKIIGVTVIGTGTTKLLAFNQVERIILRQALTEIGFY